MTEQDFASGADDAHEDAFTAEEQAAFDAMRAETPMVGDHEVNAERAPAARPEGAPAAEPAPALAPEAAPGEVVDPDAADADDAEANKGRFVRHGAFHKEREGRKAAQRELAELREKFARGDERMRLLTEAMQGRGAPGAPAAVETPAAAPDPETDIFAYAKHLEAQIAALASGQQKAAEERTAEREHSDLVGHYRSDAQRFAAAEPAFAQAYAFLVQNRSEELALNGFSPAEIAQAINADEMALAKACRSSGVSAAERLFKMASLRGFKPAAPESAPTAPAAPAETAAERVARVNAGQAAAKSLSSAGGQPAGEVTLEALASMSEDEFAAYLAKNPKRAAALMGA